ncbi:DUF6397 family protein [Streptomyces sp. NBC_01498]|uniref:DUF6397 family protein n=1 Tax=Streptomyces sp. NBC_01498 TaxID=2975870 RepID=UPI002E7C17B5|nr:DUF6397 family protein [Streptomyces sp. NBC_01498]WTL28435.1 DUF6397 family protein [Streptomyces sp. NBC_01498]
MSVREISETLAAGRAAQELRLKRGEFELAAQLGHVRTVGGLVSGRRRVARGEIERLRRSPGFPEALRERVRTVGTAEGAELLGVSSGRFTRLARAGYLVPVRFYLNRYRAVVWLYLAEDLRLFASGEPGLLTGRLPRTRTGEGAGEDSRAHPEPGESAGIAGSGSAPVEDCRPRNWRGRRIGLLLHESDDRWERAAIVGSVLDPLQLAELVPDPYERACLNRLRPDLAPGRPGTEVGREALRRLLTADDPDEISWHRSSLTALLADARREREAPRPSAPAHDPSGTPDRDRTSEVAGAAPDPFGTPDPLPGPIASPPPAPVLPAPAPAPTPERAGRSVPERAAEPVRTGAGGGGRGRPLLTRLGIGRHRDRVPDGSPNRPRRAATTHHGAGAAR